MGRGRGWYVQEYADLTSQNYTYPPSIGVHATHLSLQRCYRRFGVLDGDDHVHGSVGASRSGRHPSLPMASSQQLPWPPLSLGV